MDKKSKKTITTGQQQDTTENKMGSKDRVYQPFELTAASYIACKNPTFKETCDLFYFNKIIAIFAETYIGVLHDGDLLEHHMVLIGASVWI